MKTKTMLKNTGLVLLLALGMASCKKDKKTETPTPEPVPVVSISIDDLKKLSTSATVSVPDGKKISGIIISDATAKNIDAKTVVIQEAADKSGIIINFDAAQTFAVGDEVEIDISKQTLAQLNGEIVLDKIPLTKAKKLNSGKTIAARATTVDEVIKNAVSWDGTLISLSSGLLTGGNGKYAGTLEFTDAKGKVSSLITSGATFENKTYISELKSFTGIVRVNGNTIRVDMRGEADAVKADGAIVYTYTEDFQTGVNTADYKSSINQIWPLTTGNWMNVNFYYDFATPKTGDGGFLTAGRKYLYLYGNSAKLHRIITQFGNKIAGVKKITIKIAGSLDVSNNNGTTFDPTTNSYIVNVLGLKREANPISSSASGALIDDVTFNDQGSFHTITIKIPTATDLLSKGWTQDQIDYFMQNPNFIFRASTTTSTNTGGMFPVVIEKIDFGFDVKPTWAP
jgi:hypothetical protein